MDIIIVGGGIGGLTLALTLHEKGIACQVFEASATIRTEGVGLNLLPHSTKEMARLGLEDALGELAITTRESCFFNRFGQLIWCEPVGRYAGYQFPQLSIHRGDLLQVLVAAVRARIGEDRVHLGHKCTGVEERDGQVEVHFADPGTGASLSSVAGRAVIGCDGIHSAIRAKLYPNEGEAKYSGVNMWRGVTRMHPVRSGASMMRLGWLSTGKMVIYPIRNAIDAEGRQLMNWAAEIETPHHLTRDWNRRGRLEDFLPAFADWHFDWLDVPGMIRNADMVLEYPMVDQDPLERWSFGRITLLGDAAHPMYPRGSNGAGQAILDARALAECLSDTDDVEDALQVYDIRRREPTAEIVRANRTRPPDTIIREVVRRTGDKPFGRIEDVISTEELAAISDKYKDVAGYSLEQVNGAA